jgi:hypothetical protein
MSHGKCTYWITILVWPDCKVFNFDLVLANSRYVIGSWNLQHMNDNRFYRFCFALMFGLAINIKGFELPSCFMRVHDLNQNFLQIRNKTNEKISSLCRVLSELNQKVGWWDLSLRLKRVVSGFWNLNPSRVWSLACCHEIWELKIQNTRYIYTTHIHTEMDNLTA